MLIAYYITDYITKDFRSYLYIICSIREYNLKKKYHGMADVLFILFGFSYFAYVE